MLIVVQDIVLYWGKLCDTVGKSDRSPGRCLRLEIGCSVVGLQKMMEVLVDCVWRQVVDIRDSGILIPLSLFWLLGWSLIWIAFFVLREYRCWSWAMH